MGTLVKRILQNAESVLLVYCEKPRPALEERRTESLSADSRPSDPFVAQRTPLS